MILERDSQSFSFEIVPKETIENSSTADAYKDSVLAVVESLGHLSWKVVLRFLSSRNFGEKSIFLQILLLSWEGTH